MRQKTVRSLPDGGGFGILMPDLVKKIRQRLMKLDPTRDMSYDRSKNGYYVSIADINRLDFNEAVGPYEPKHMIALAQHIYALGVDTFCEGLVIIDPKGNKLQGVSRLPTHLRFPVTSKLEAHIKRAVFKSGYRLVPVDNSDDPPAPLPPEEHEAPVEPVKDEKEDVTVPVTNNAMDVLGQVGH